MTLAWRRGLRCCGASRRARSGMSVAVRSTRPGAGGAEWRAPFQRAWNVCGAQVGVGGTQVCEMAGRLSTRGGTTSSRVGGHLVHLWVGLAAVDRFGGQDGVERHSAGAGNVDEKRDAAQGQGGGDMGLAQPGQTVAAVGHGLRRCQALTSSARSVSVNPVRPCSVSTSSSIIRCSSSSDRQGTSSHTTRSSVGGYRLRHAVVSPGPSACTPTRVPARSHPLATPVRQSTTVAKTSR